MGRNILYAKNNKAVIVFEELFRSITESLNKLEIQLRTFNRYVACLNRHARGRDSNREIGAAVVDMFELIIDLWMYAGVTLQGSAVGKKEASMKVMDQANDKNRQVFSPRNLVLAEV